MLTPIEIIFLPLFFFQNNIIFTSCTGKKPD
jgi:hypothetical protein